MLIALLFGLLSCSPDEGTVDVYLTHSPDVTEDPLDPELTTHLRIRVSGGGMEPVEELFEFESGAASQLPGIPVGDDRVITVEGLSGEDGYAVSRGRTLPIEIREGRQEIDLFIARVGRFSFTPNYGLSQARFGHGSILAGTGELFVVGGATSGTYSSPDGLLGSVEKYDPTSGNTSVLACGNNVPGECLAHPRAHAAVVTVDDGILVIGGAGNKGLLRKTEIIDAAGETASIWEREGEPRVGAVTTALSAQSLIAGGLNAADQPVAHAELVSRDGIIESLDMPRAMHAAAAARSGSRVFLFGGFDRDWRVVNEFLLFGPAKKKFTVKQTDIEARAHAHAVHLSGGRVLIIGGQDGDGGASTSVDIFDPGSLAICHLGDLSYGRWLAGVVKLKDERVLVIGGLTGVDPGEPTARVEMLDARFVEVRGGCDQLSGMLSVSVVPDAKIRRYASSAMLLQNGVVAVAGGIDHEGRAVKQIEIFVPDE